MDYHAGSKIGITFLASYGYTTYYKKHQSSNPTNLKKIGIPLSATSPLFDEETNKISLSYLLYFTSTGINIFAHMCLYCALGEILVAQCNGIYYAAYKNQWYSMDPKLTRNLLFIMMRGSKPVYLTAGKIFPVTMTTFCGVRCSYLTIFVTLIV
ncbi:odorant receptor 4-like [Cardiocondyla obscurior]|uniref:odorant receptor 4-like n=1 Tax=Cardiocondyla obscurior TaxID=286306 RepID=UPI0039656E21